MPKEYSLEEITGEPEYSLEDITGKSEKPSVMPGGNLFMDTIGKTILSDKPMQRLKSSLLGATQGFTFNQAPNLASIFSNALSPGMKGEDAKRFVTEQINQAKQADPSGYTGGEITGAIANSALLPEAKILQMAGKIPGVLKAGKLLKQAPVIGKTLVNPMTAKAGLNALEGAAIGAGEAELNDQDAIEGAKTGALTGAATSLGLDTLNKIPLRELAKRLEKYSKSLAASAIGATKSFRNKIPDQKIQDIGELMLNKGIVTPLASPRNKQDAINQLVSRSSNKLGSVYNQLDELGIPSPMSGKKLSGNIKDELSDVFTENVNIPARTPINRALQDITNLGESPTFSEAWRKKKNIQNVVFPGDKINPSAGKEYLNKIRGSLGDEMQSAADVVSQQANRPALGQKLANLNKQSNLSLLSKDMIDDKISQEGNKRLNYFDLLLGGSVATGTGLGTGDPLSSIGYGLTAMTGKKAIDRYGANMGAIAAKKTASGLQNLIDKSKKVGNLPKLLGDNGKLPINHFILMQTDPEYSKRYQEKE
jgi:hypothetical protein